MIPHHVRREAKRALEKGRVAYAGKDDKSSARVMRDVFEHTPLTAGEAYVLMERQLARLRAVGYDVGHLTGRVAVQKLASRPGGAALALRFHEAVVKRSGAIFDRDTAAALLRCLAEAGDWPALEGFLRRDVFPQASAEDVSVYTSAVVRLRKRGKTSEAVNLLALTSRTIPREVYFVLKMTLAGSTEDVARILEDAVEPEPLLWSAALHACATLRCSRTARAVVGKMKAAGAVLDTRHHKGLARAFCAAGEFWRAAELVKMLHAAGSLHPTSQAAGRARTASNAPYAEILDGILSGCCLCGTAAGAAFARAMFLASDQWLPAGPPPRPVPPGDLTRLLGKPAGAEPLLVESLQALLEKIGGAADARDTHRTLRRMRLPSSWAIMRRSLGLGACLSPAETCKVLLVSLRSDPQTAWDLWRVAEKSYAREGRAKSFRMHCAALKILAARCVDLRDAGTRPGDRQLAALVTEAHGVYGAAARALPAGCQPELQVKFLALLVSAGDGVAAVRFVERKLVRPAVRDVAWNLARLACQKDATRPKAWALPSGAELHLRCAKARPTVL